MLSPLKYAERNQPQILGHYRVTDEIINDRPVYQSEKYDGADGIWFCGSEWYMGQYAERGLCVGYAHGGFFNSELCVETLVDNWRIFDPLKNNWDEDVSLHVRCT